MRFDYAAGIPAAGIPAAFASGRAMLTAQQLESLHAGV